MSGGFLGIEKTKNARGVPGVLGRRRVRQGLDGGQKLLLLPLRTRRCDINLNGIGAEHLVYSTVGTLIGGITRPRDPEAHGEDFVMSGREPTPFVEFRAGDKRSGVQFVLAPDTPSHETSSEICFQGVRRLRIDAIRFDGEPAAPVVIAIRSFVGRLRSR